MSKPQQPANATQGLRRTITRTGKGNIREILPIRYSALNLEPTTDCRQQYSLMSGVEGIIL